MLNHAAVETANRSMLRTGLGLVAATFVFAASPAFALDGIDLSSEPAPVAEGECPLLVQIKYPFLSCADGQIGLSGADETWETERQMIRQGDFTESDAGWRPYTLHPID